MGEIEHAQEAQRAAFGTFRDEVAQEFSAGLQGLETRQAARLQEATEDVYLRAKASAGECLDSLQGKVQGRVEEIETSQAAQSASLGTFRAEASRQFSAGLQELEMRQAARLQEVTEDVFLRAKASCGEVMDILQGKLQGHLEEMEHAHSVQAASIAESRTTVEAAKEEQRAALDAQRGEVSQGLEELRKDFAGQLEGLENGWTSGQEAEMVQKLSQAVEAAANKLARALLGAGAIFGCLQALASSGFCMAVPIAAAAAGGYHCARSAPELTFHSLLEGVRAKLSNPSSGVGGCPRTVFQVLLPVTLLGEARTRAAGVTRHCQQFQAREHASSRLCTLWGGARARLYKASLEESSAHALQGSHPSGPEGEEENIGLAETSTYAGKRMIGSIGKEEQHEDLEAQEQSGPPPEKRAKRSDPLFWFRNDH